MSQFKVMLALICVIVFFGFAWAQQPGASSESRVYFGPRRPPGPRPLPPPGLPPGVTRLPVVAAGSQPSSPEANTEEDTLEGRRPVTVSEVEDEGRPVSTREPAEMQRIIGLWRQPDSGRVIDIRPDGTAIYHDPGPGQYSIKRGDIIFKNFRAVGDAFEVTVMASADSSTCRNSAPLPVKGTIRVDSGGDALLLSSTGYYYDPSSCQWTKIVLGSFTRTYHRVSARKVNSERKN